MIWMRADPSRGHVGGGWALAIEIFLGPVKWHRAVRRVPFGAQKSRDFHQIDYELSGNRGKIPTKANLQLLQEKLFVAARIALFAHQQT